MKAYFKLTEIDSPCSVPE